MLEHRIRRHLPLDPRNSLGRGRQSVCAKLILRNGNRGQVNYIVIDAHNSALFISQKRDRIVPFDAIPALRNAVYPNEQGPLAGLFHSITGSFDTCTKVLAQT